MSSDTRATRPDHPAHPVSRLSAPEIAHLPPAVREIFDAETERFGAPLNTTTVMAHHPALLATYKAWSAAMNAAGTLIPAALTYLIYVRVASLNGCPF